MTTEQIIEKKPITGKIIKLDEKGYGFISSEEIPFTRIFFHWSGLKQDTKKFTDLKKGMKVEFIPIELPVVKKEGSAKTTGGFRAIHIRVLDGVN